jgi:tetratricopeptide (TPR) repeat protein
MAMVPTGGRMKIRNLAFCLLLAFGLSACSAVGVIESSDPAVKLEQAGDLLGNLDRPGPAERLIREAIDIYQQRGDEAGLADAYRGYGYFYRSIAVHKRAEIYRQHGFLDKTATYNTRYEKSAEYYERAEALYLKLGRSDLAMQVQFNKARVLGHIGEKDKACAAYDQSLEAYRKNIAANTGVKANLPAGYSDYEEMVRENKRAAGCP